MDETKSQALTEKVLGVLADENGMFSVIEASDLIGVLGTAATLIGLGGNIPWDQVKEIMDDANQKTQADVLSAN